MHIPSYVKFPAIYLRFPAISIITRVGVSSMGNTLRVFKTTETLIHAFITSKLDNCNYLLFGLPKHLIDKLQAVQNASARLVTLSRKHDHITPVLIDLHWLPVAARIKFKIIILTFKALHGLSPVYIQDLITIHKPARNLRSSSHLLLSSKSYILKSTFFLSRCSSTLELSTSFNYCHFKRVLKG